MLVTNACRDLVAHTVISWSESLNICWASPMGAPEGSLTPRGLPDVRKELSPRASSGQRDSLNKVDSLHFAPLRTWRPCASQSSALV